MRIRRAFFLSVLFLSACATQEKTPEAEAPAPPPAAKPPPAAPKAVAPKPKRPGPIATRALNVKTDCGFRDETGYSGAMKLAIEEAQVLSFNATVNIPKRGICRFDLKNFRQVRKMPTVELSHLSDPCVVRVWEQGERITVAFTQCQRMCSGNAADYLWPILTDTRDGSCA